MRIIIVVIGLIFLILSLSGMLYLSRQRTPQYEVRLLDLIRKKENVAQSGSLDPSDSLGYKSRGHQVHLENLDDLAGIQLNRERRALSGIMRNSRGVLRIKLKHPNEEYLHSVAVEVLTRSSGSLAIGFISPREQDIAEFLRKEDVLSWDLVTPLIADGKPHSYLLQPKRPVRIAEGTDLLIRPVNIRGASFKIRGITLISRDDYVESIPSGLGWYGMNEVYREALVLRPPSVSTVRARVPAHGKLDLSIAKIASELVAFSVAIQPTEGASSSRVITRRVRLPNRWFPWSIDLSDYAGEGVALTFSVSSNSGQAHGFLGSPIIRGTVRQPRTVRSGVRRPRGVIIIWVDSLRKDHLRSYGYGRETAPAISALARQGVLFKDCISQGSWTKVATPSLLASLYPLSHGVLDFSDKLPYRAVTLPEVFQKAGYSTVSFSSILLTGKFSNLHQGFDEVVESLSFPDRDSSKTSHVYVPKLIKWLEEHRDNPFFAFLHLYDPHDPYRPKEPYDGLWVGDDAARTFGASTGKVETAISDPLLRRFLKPTSAELRRVSIEPEEYAQVPKDWYDASIVAMDSELGRLFRALDRLGLDRDTLVVIAGDHGEEFFDHGRMFHGQSVYSELIEVPLIFWWPGVIAGRVEIDATAEIVDVMPTVLDLSGLAIPVQVQGQSFAEYIKVGSSRARLPRKPAFAMKAAVVEALSPPPRESESYAVVADGWKLIQNVISEKGKAEFELFDRRKDPMEQINLAQAHPERVKRLVRLLDSWRRSTLQNRIIGNDLGSEPMSDEMLHRLESLGYLQAQH